MINALPIWISVTLKTRPGILATQFFSESGGNLTQREAQVKGFIPEVRSAERGPVSVVVRVNGTEASSLIQLESTRKQELPHLPRRCDHG
jgi:hypothetical protein